MLRVDTHVVEPLGEEWMLARAVPGASELSGCWPAAVPGTVAAALNIAGEPSRDLDDFDWWFRRPLEVRAPQDGEEVVLQLDGIATLADIYLDGAQLLHSPSMFARHTVDIGGRLGNGSSELAIVCRALTSALSVRRPRPRFRAQGVRDQRLRYFRTTLLGRGLGSSGGTEPVGPYRQVSVIRRRTLVVESYTRTATLSGAGGDFVMEAIVRPLSAVRIVAARLLLRGPTGEHAAEAELCALADGCIQMTNRLAIDDVAPWRPHTHGTPHLYEVEVDVELSDGTNVRLADAPTGFRSISGGELERFALSVSGVPVFCRGALWVPPDPTSLNSSTEEIERRLMTLRDAGMNMVRIPGTGIWEDEALHRICDELGLLMWQDLMLARMDYPTDDPEFLAVLTEEVDTELRRLGRHASTAVICGGSEVEQQAAMVGLRPEVGRSAFIRETLPAIAARHCPEVPVVPSSPSGGDLPFRVSAGVAQYFGVGGYMRPLADARLAAVPFASECLAFANVPEQELLDEMAHVELDAAVPGSPDWKRGVPRDAGTSWDFEDVRDHYLGILYGIDPGELRRQDPAYYLDLSRLVSGEAMAATVAEWRREASPCAGALVLQAADTSPGSGWGLLDIRGRPKAALAVLRRTCLARAIWCTDEGLDGIDIHVANDEPEELVGVLRVALYREDGVRVEEVRSELEVPPHQVVRVGVEELLGRFVDVGWCYHFGPRNHDLVVASLHADPDDPPLLQHFQTVGPRSVRREPPGVLGLGGNGEWRDGAIHALVGSSRFAWGVRVNARGFTSDDSWFGLEPGRPREVTLRPVTSDATATVASIAAVNASGRGEIKIVTASHTGATEGV